MISTEFVERCGHALYGSRWQRELARALNVSDRTVRRWAAGTSAINEKYASIISSLMLAKIGRLKHLASQIENTNGE